MAHIDLDTAGKIRAFALHHSVALAYVLAFAVAIALAFALAYALASADWMPLTDA